MVAVAVFVAVVIPASRCCFIVVAAVTVAKLVVGFIANDGPGAEKETLLFDSKI